MTFTINERNRTAAARRLIKNSRYPYQLTNGGPLNSNLIITESVAVWCFDAVKDIKKWKYYDDNLIFNETGARDVCASRKTINSFFDACTNELPLEFISYNQIKVYCMAAKKAGLTYKSFTPIIINNTLYNAEKIKDVLTIINGGCIRCYTDASQGIKPLLLDAGTGGAYIMPIQWSDAIAETAEKIGAAYDNFLLLEV